MLTREMIFRVAVPVFVLAGGIACWLWVRGAQADNPSQASPDNSSVRGTRVRVWVVKPQQGGVERTVARPGTVRAYQFAQLFTKVSGYLQNQKVDIGSRVEGKQLLAEIYAPELTADVRKAESDLKKAKAQVEVMTARLAAAKANLQQANARVGQAEADVESARAMTTLRRQEYKRIDNLATQGAVDKELVDEKNQARRAAEASERSSDKALVTAKAAVVAAAADVTSAGANLEDARAQVEVAEAVLSRARIWQDYTQIRSPYTGVITQRGYHDSDFIRADTAGGTQPPVLTVARTDLMRIVVWVPDPDVPYTHAGQKVTLRVASMPDRTFTGIVARTADAEDPNTRTMRTEVDLPNPDNLLKEGMFGTLTLHLGRTKQGLTIPSDCLFGPEKLNKRSVHVVRGGKAVQVSVLVGQDDGIRAEALEGLSTNDQVIEQHDPGLANGVPVEVVPPSK
jgi:HlyD family secretion protein